VKRTIKPHSSGGLLHLLVPNANETSGWSNVTDVQEMEQHLLEYSREYFKQAHGTPYTIPPLSHLLQYDVLKEFGDAVHAGTADFSQIEIEDATRLLL